MSLLGSKNKKVNKYFNLNYFNQGQTLSLPYNIACLCNVFFFSRSRVKTMRKYSQWHFFFICPCLDGHNKWKSKFQKSTRTFSARHAEILRHLTQANRVNSHHPLKRYTNIYSYQKYTSLLDNHYPSYCYDIYFM